MLRKNTRIKVFNRDGHKCQCCKGKNEDSKLELHHIIFRSQGGNNSAENLIVLCHTCHKALHAGKINLDFIKLKKGFAVVVEVRIPQL